MAKEKKKLLSLEKVVDIVLQIISPLKKFYNNFPDGNGTTFAVKNRKIEAVAGDGYEVLAMRSASAYSLAIAGLNRGVLIIPENTSAETVKEVVNLLGEETYAELTKGKVRTLELKPRLTEKQLLQKARDNYERRKVTMAKMAENLKAIEAKKAENSDVEPLKSE